MKRTIGIGVLILAALGSVFGQSLGNAGTIEGTVVDSSGAVVSKAAVTIHNPVTGYRQSTASDKDGAFRLVNIPPNPYHLEVRLPGFEAFAEDITIRNSIPVQIKATLAVAGSKTEVTVEATGADMLELTSTAHVDTDYSSLLKLPTIDPGAGLSQAITYSSGGVAADGNGFFHPLGDHAEVSFVIDGQPISDQQSKVFSTQLPSSAVQNMELTTGSPAAEFGDKTSLIANVTTRSGLGSGHMFGNYDVSYGSFGTVGSSVGVGFGNEKVGNFLAADGTGSNRFLDTPEFVNIHDGGDNESLFDRFDFQPNGTNVFHLNLFAARNGIQIPNSYDQLTQDQRQRVLTWSFAPGYQHTFSAHTLLTINPYIRKDQFNYYASPNLFDDQPATQSQNRQLLNWGVKADISTLQGKHNLKYGIDVKQTRLLENFNFGITDPTFNSPCINGDGISIGNPSLTNPSQCASAGYQPNVASNPNATTPFSAALLAYDLTRHGTLFAFHGTGNIDQYAFYGQDEITLGHFLVTVGLRVDGYYGLTTSTQPEPRLGLAYNLKKTGTVLRTAYARTMETPFNENLLLSNATGTGGLAQNVFGSNSVAIQPGFRNQFNGGFEQTLGKFLLLDADYFWKFTHNAFDFSTLLNTTITFPIAWHNSKTDGVTGRLSTTNLHGFQAYETFGHSRARYFPPEDGGLIPQGAPLAAGVFRIDHDQAFQSTGVFRYQHKNFEWIAFTWRYDSGLVVSGVPDAAAAMTLTPNQEVTIGLACNGVYATAAAPITACNGTVTSKLLTLPQTGQENDDHNPDRVKPRNVFNLGIGSDNLFHKEGRRKFTASVDIANVTNKVAIYNFLSTFSGTHFLQPRTISARIGLVF
jgi:hypothetical protein